MENKTKNQMKPSNKLEISFKRPYHIFNEQKSFPNRATYKKFLNWVSGEFDLNLQDESDTLKIFFPTKRLIINVKPSGENENNVEIHIESRVLHEGFKLKEKLEMIYQSLIQMAH